MIPIVCGTAMIMVLLGVGTQIVNFRQHIVRGPQCARCPLYQTACKELELYQDGDNEAKPATTTPEMAI